MIMKKEFWVVCFTLAVFVFAFGNILHGANAQFKASVQEDYSMVAPADISSIYFYLRYLNDSVATYQFATDDTTRIGVYDTIVSLGTDSLGMYRADWYVNLVNGRTLHFSQYPIIDDMFVPEEDSVVVDVSAADAGLIPAIEDTIYANRTDYMGGTGSLDSSTIADIVIEHLDSLMQKLGVQPGATVVYEWHPDADTTWYTNASGDTVRISISLHTGKTKGAMPDTTMEIEL